MQQFPLGMDLRGLGEGMSRRLVGMLDRLSRLSGNMLPAN